MTGIKTSEVPVDILAGVMSALRETGFIGEKDKLSWCEIPASSIDFESIDWLNIQFELEKKFGINTDPEDLGSFTELLIVGNLVEYVQKNLGLRNHYAGQFYDPANPSHSGPNVTPNFYIRPLVSRLSGFIGEGYEMIDARLAGAMHDIRLRGSQPGGYAESRALIFNPEPSQNVPASDPPGYRCSRFLHCVITPAGSVVKSYVFDDMELVPGYDGPAQCRKELEHLAKHLGRNYEVLER